MHLCDAQSIKYDSIPLQSASKEDSLFYKDLLNQWKSFHLKYRDYPEKPLIYFVPDNLLIPNILSNEELIENSVYFFDQEVDIFFFRQIDGKEFIMLSVHDDIAPMSAFYIKNKKSKKWEKIEIPVNKSEYGVREIMGVLGDNEKIWVSIDVFREGVTEVYSYNLKTKISRLLGSMDILQ